MRRTTITSLFLILAAAAPAFPEILIHTKDGRTIRVQVDANEISSIDFTPSQSQPSDVLGRVWNAQENGYAGTWTRRGNSNVFDAVWVNGSSRVTAVMTMTIQGSDVHIARRQDSYGSNCDYTGRISADGRSVSGTHVCGTAKYQWSATIQK